MASIDYKNYWIAAFPRQIADSGEWTGRVLIRNMVRPIPESINIRTFFLRKKTYKTEEEVNQVLIEYAKHIIDGKVPGKSMANP